MKSFLSKIKIVLEDKILRKRIVFTLGALVLFRLLSIIPVPGVDHTALASFLDNNEFLGLLNVFSGGGLSQLSLLMLGVGPYITASIIMQLMTVVFPKLKEIYQEEGEAGRRKFAGWTRNLSVPLAMLQSFAFLRLLESQKVLAGTTGFDFLVNVIIITAGSMLLMWIGELITEYGIGNGISLIIFAGIVSVLPSQVNQFIFAFDKAQIFVYLAFLVITLLVILGVVVITEAERPIPITYAKQVRGNRVYGGTSTYLPLRLNQSGVLPIIFAVSILTFPQLIATFISQTDINVLKNIAGAVNTFIQNAWVYGIVYFFLVFVFTYFYTAVTFDPTQISSNLQKNGAFIPGVRPGDSTSLHISKILTRLTLFGAMFLSLIAVLPLVVRSITGITAVSIGGTALLIVVSVVIDLIRKVDAQISIREY